MKKVSLPALNRGLIPRIDALKEESKQTITMFCNDKVKEAKLATRNFFFNFDFYGYRNSELRKSVQRLTTLFQRDLAKTVPFIAFAAKPYSLENSSRSTFSIALKTHTHTEEIPFIVAMGMWEQPFEAVINSLHEGDNYVKPFRHAVKSLDRYTRFLARRCAQNNLPLNVTCSTEMVLTPETEATIRKMYDKRSESVGKVFELNYTIVTELTIHLGFWTETDNNRNFLPLMSGLRNIPLTADNVEDTCVEKLFFYLEDFKKPLKTLIRKTSYDTDAFVVGNIQT